MNSPGPSFDHKPSLLVLMGAILATLLVFTQSPFVYSLSYLGIPPASDKQDLEDLLVNFLMYLPLGFLLSHYVRLSYTAGYGRIVLLVTLVCLLCSAAMELAQSLSSRTASVYDVLSNVIGGQLGALAYIVWGRGLLRFIAYLWRGISRPWVSWMLAIVFWLIAFMLICWPYAMKTGFSNWYTHHSLYLGDTGVGGSAWHGELHYLAIYEKPLTSGDVSRHYQNRATGSAGAASSMAGQGLLVEYDFSRRGESVPDLAESSLSASGQLDLQVKEPANVRWMQPSGVRIEEPTVLFTHSPGALFRYLRRKTPSQLTIELWLKSTHLSGSHLSRVLTATTKSNSANFMIGQQGRDLTFRLRTPLTGVDPIDPVVEVQNAMNGALQHVVLTVDQGLVSVFLDGELKARNDLNDKRVNRYDRLALEYSTYFKTYRLPFWYLLYFPVNFLIRAGCAGTGQGAAPGVGGFGRGMAAWLCPLLALFVLHHSLIGEPVSQGEAAIITLSALVSWMAAAALHRLARPE